MNADLIKQWIFVIIRYASPYVAGYLSTKLGVTSSDASAWIATTVTMLMATWALVNKYRYETKVNTALDLGPGASKQTLKNVIASGDGTSATAIK